MYLEYPFDLNYNITCVYTYSSTNGGEVSDKPFVDETETTQPEPPEDTADNNGAADEQLDFSDTSRFVKLSTPDYNNIETMDDANSTEEPVKLKKAIVEYIIDDNSDKNFGTNDSVFVSIDESISNATELKNKINYGTTVKRRVKQYINSDVEKLVEHNIDDFNVYKYSVCGKDWFLSESLYNKYFKDILNNSGIEQSQHELYYIKESDVLRDLYAMGSDLLYNKDIVHWWKINNVNVIISKNKFSDDELTNFSQTFFNIISKYSNYKYEPGSDRTVSVYNKLIQYYINNKTDKTLSDIDLILNTNINTQTSNTTGSSFCGCNNSSNSATDRLTVNQSCYNIYNSALQTWTKEMFGDISKFYNNWFFDAVVNGNNKECLKPNIALCELLQTLINEYINTNPDIQSIINSSQSASSQFVSDKLYCGCEKSKITSPCDYNILNNFNQVLEYIKNNDVVANINKIQYYGQQFGELIYNL